MTVAVELRRPDKVLWPATGFTKADLRAYYEAIAPVLLPHLADRPLTLARFPDGVEVPGWYQTNCHHRPSWMRVAPVVGRRGQPLAYCLIDDVAGLAWAANAAAIELHPFLARAAAPDRPLVVVFDLDPGPPADLLTCARVALAVRACLAQRGREAYVKTSGAAGLHVVALARPRETFAETKPLARAIAEEVGAALPALTVATMARAARAGRVYIDWRQNDANRSTIAPYSPRATRVPLVSAPVTWDELEEALTAGEARRLAFAPADVLSRVQRSGDPFAPLARPQQW